MNDHPLLIDGRSSSRGSLSFNRRGVLKAFVVPLAGSTGLAACGGSNREDLNLPTDFTSVREPWQAGFADYAPGNADFNLVSGVRAVPGLGISGLLLGGTNRSGDLFMFIHRVVGGLRANQKYRLAFTVNIATNAPSGCMGMGGSPGKSVYVKAGATVKPITTATDATGVLRLVGIDHGQQFSSGPDATVLGVLANGNTDCASVSYRSKSLRGSLSISSDATGQMRLIFGTDSGFEGRTEVYWLNAIITFSIIA